MQWNAFLRRYSTVFLFGGLNNKLSLIAYIQYNI
nr:MAG TPA: hypothetical protein [Caudoviricetes sp.]